MDLELQGQSLKNNDQLNTYTSTFTSILDDFKKYYVFTNQYPDVAEYQNYFLNNKTQLQNINRDVILLTNSIKKDIEQLDYMVTRINTQLGDEKELNKELLKLMENMKNSNNGSSLLLDETTAIYNKQYLLNVELLIGIFLVSGLIGMHLKKH